MTPIYFAHHHSPIGTLLLSGDGRVLNGLWILGERHVPTMDAAWQRDDDLFGDVREQLDAYFSGDLRTFDVSHGASIGTAFQKQVWKALAEIPYGATISYGELARRIGKAAAVRAVGAANGQNPLSIIVPCHRVIGASGKLTGYGGGLAAKQWLLAHELRHSQTTLTLG
jgi:methylated-DNA-[protein]-cysteine S-methyltransferase